MSVLQLIKIEKIDRCEDSRVIDPAQVTAIVEDMRVSGAPKPSPFDVIQRGERYQQVFGQHRLAAYIESGLDEIECRVFQPDDFEHAADIKLHQVKENLFQRSLTALDRALAINDWKEAYEAKYPVYSHGGRRRKATEDDQVDKMSTCFSVAAAEALGWNEKTIRRSLSIAQKINLDLIGRLSLTAIAKKQSELLALVDESHDRQEEIVKLVLDDGTDIATVADAIAFIDRTPAKPAQAKWAILSDTFGKLQQKEQHAFFDAHADAIDAWIASR